MTTNIQGYGLSQIFVNNDLTHNMNWETSYDGKNLNLAVLTNDDKKNKNSYFIELSNNDIVNLLNMPVSKKTLENISEIQKIAHRFKEPLMGRLTLGAIHTLSPYLLPIILLPLKESFPNLDLVLFEATTNELLEELESGKIDAALLATSIKKEKNLKELKLFKEPFWLAHPANHKIYGVDNITVKQLQKLDLLLLPEEHCLSDQVKSVCGIKSNDSDSPMQWLHAGSLETILQFVAKGQGSTLVPALATYEGRVNSQGLIVRKLEIDTAYRNISMAYRKDFSKESDLKILGNFIVKNLPNIVDPI